MTTNINWSLVPDGINKDQLYHCASCDGPQDKQVQQFINSVIDRAIAIIPQSMNDNARYLLFSWNQQDACLEVVTTDDNKVQDSLESIKTHIAQWHAATGCDQSETMHYWIRDYLTTCPEFLHYSLIAIFCEGDRSKTRLL